MTTSEMTAALADVRLRMLDDAIGGCPAALAALEDWVDENDRKNDLLGTVTEAVQGYREHTEKLDEHRSDRDLYNYHIGARDRHYYRAVKLLDCVPF